MYTRNRELSLFVVLTLVVVYLCPPSLVSGPVGTVDSRLITSIGSDQRSSVMFTANVGQWPDSILFRSVIDGTVMWIVRDGIYYEFSRKFQGSPADSKVSSFGFSSPTLAMEDKDEDAPVSLMRLLVKAEFDEMGDMTSVVGEKIVKHKSHFLLGDDPGHWFKDVPSYSAIRFQGIRPGVDAVLSGDGSKLRLILEGATNESVVPRINYRGGVQFQNPDGSVTLETEIGSKKFMGLLPETREPERSYALLPAEATENVSLAYSTYVGGSQYDEAIGIAIDLSGNAYVTGWTASTNFPTQSPIMVDPNDNIGDVIVTKLSSAGNSLIYSTYLGGSLQDHGYDIAVDSQGSAYVTGHTYSSNFPTQLPYQAYPGDGQKNVFVVKLSASGSSLVYGTYLGGSDNEDGYGIAVDGFGQAFVTGHTYSTNFPTLNAFQMDQDFVYDAFVTKLNANGNGLIYSTYIGGVAQDHGYDIAVGSNGDAFVVGQTSSPDFPTQSPFMLDPGDGFVEDAFVIRLSPTGSLVYSTYLGGDGWDEGRSIAVDNSGHAFVTGNTYSTDFPLVTPYQTDQPDRDVFVTKLSVAGNSAIFSTYLGGNLGDFGEGIGVDSTGNVYVGGYTNSTNFPVLWPFQTDNTITDVFVTKFGPTGTKLSYSTYLAGSLEDHGNDLAVDKAGNAYITGLTGSSDFPILNAFQGNQGGTDFFITKMAVFDPDTDLDGIPDVLDNCPSIANNGQEDLDTDGVGNVCDNCLSVANPLQEDSNNDGIGDACCCIGETGNVNASPLETPDLSDLSLLISYLTQTPRPVLPCPMEANLNLTGAVDLSDLSLLISYLTTVPRPTLNNCP